jgi:hypothetical protein
MRSLPSGEMSGLRAKGMTLVGTMSRTPSGSGVGFPFVEDENLAVVVVGGQELVFQPQLRASCQAHGFWVMNESGPASTTNGSVRGGDDFGTDLAAPAVRLFSSV